ncbi:hypothetical protein [Micromonospora sp. NBC_01412]|uniref:hypothetical protein n=1 Tax=Micromonospora sp. NBC_01412 TaxID=2903590 RepID=UPI003255DFA2
MTTTDDEPDAAIERVLDEAYAAFDAERYDRAGELLTGVAVGVAPGLAKALWFDAALCALRMRDWPTARDRGLQAVRFVERERAGVLEPRHRRDRTAGLGPGP